jgi:hypothetical protein
MAINFPTSLDSLTNPTSSDTLNSPDHALQHANANDAVEALEAKVGVNSSAVTTSLDYILKNSSSSNPGHRHTLAQGATDVTSTSTQLNYLSSATGTTGTTSTNVVFSTSPTLVTPVLGIATATSVNKITITAPASGATLTIIDGKTLTINNTLTFSGTDSSTLNIGGGGTLGSNAYTSTAYAPIASPTFTGTVTIPTSFVIGAVTVTTTGTQLNYLNAATGTTGTTSTNLVFSTSPTLVTPTLGAASATSINKVAITAPASSATLTIADGKTLTINNTLTFSGTDSSTLNIGGGGTLGSNAYTSTAFAPIASPTFTGTVVIPTPFTLGAVSVTATGTQLNYLAAATGTTGTTSTNVVFSTSPVLVTPTLGVAKGTSLVLGTTTALTTLHVYDANDSATLTNFTQAVSSAGILVSSDYNVGNYMPGMFWQNIDNNSTVPKAGMWAKITANGSEIWFGTSQNYGTGITQIGLQLTAFGGVVLGAQAALATNATEGFTYIPTSAGAPTGVPAAYTGKVAMEYDTTNNKLYVYNGAWKSVTLA